MTDLVRRTPSLAPRNVLTLVGMGTAAFFGAGLAMAIASAAAERASRDPSQRLVRLARPTREEGAFRLDPDGSALFV
jgi:hypothetical protein